MTHYNRLLNLIKRITLLKGGELATVTESVYRNCNGWGYMQYTCQFKSVVYIFQHINPLDSKIHASNICVYLSMYACYMDTHERLWTNQSRSHPDSFQNVFHDISMAIFWHFILSCKVYEHWTVLKFCICKKCKKIHTSFKLVLNILILIERRERRSWLHL